MTAPAPAVHSELDGLSVVARRPAAASAAVVFVHGTMDRSASFGRVLRRLPHLHTIAFDRGGYAGSRGRGPVADLDAAADEVLAVAATAQARPLVLVGHSFGGLVVLRAAERATGAGVRVDTLGVFEAPMPWREEYGASAGPTTLEVARTQGPAAAAESFMRAMVGDRTWERLGERTRADRHSEGPALMADLEMACDPGSAPHPGRITAPVHAARGATSSERLRWAAAELARSCHGSLEEIPSAGHGAHLSHPDQFAQWVELLAAAPVVADTARSSTREVG